MIKIACLLFFEILLFASCKVTEKDAIGTFKLERFPKTTLTVNPDHTFDFVKINPNPYLHPSDHPDQYYSLTKGTWMAMNKRTISLTSQSDSLVYPLAEVRIQSPRDIKWSYFSFYDIYGDSVEILYVLYPNNSMKASLHRSMEYCMEDLTKTDSFEFHFYGYKPYTFVSEKKINQDYSIILKPEFQPNFFNGASFKIKRNQLIDIKRQGKFKKAKKGI